MRVKIPIWMKTAGAVLLAGAALCGAALAEGELIPVGEAVGIEITVDGVLVAGTAEVETENGALAPAKAAGVRPGDVIVALGGEPVDSAAELIAGVTALDGAAAELTVRRDGRELELAVEPALDADAAPRLGLWLRDGVTGIGTMTYIDPETGAFGAVGHGVNDTESGALLPVDEGSVCRAQIVEVRRGETGAPGELAGVFSGTDVIGRIETNTEHGIFGVMDTRPETLREALPVALSSEISAGPATILTCVDGGEAREYEVEISRTGLMGGDGRDLMVRVTDPALLALTGGIVQGMSGSPILQDGKLVGAVTHVLTSDPTRGYGILAENMLKSAA